MTAVPPSDRPDRAVDLRAVMREFPTGVSVVTTIRARHPLGMTANAIASVSLEPPMILVCASRPSTTADAVRASRCFAVNLLTVTQEHLARAFAQVGTADRFRGVTWTVAATGAPVLDAVVGWLDCRLEAIHTAGDHDIVVGRVVAAGTSEGEPLLYHRSTYLATLGCTAAAVTY